MVERVSVFAVALSLCATAAMAQPAASSPDVRGTVVRYDASYNVIVLDDGRMYRVTPNTRVLVNNQAVPVTSVQPGLPVVIHSGESVMLQNGQYVVAAPAAVAAPAPTTVVTAVPTTALKQTIYGKVTDVDRDGEVKIKTDDGAFKVTLTRDTVRQVREGDTVIIDATFAPRGTQIIR